MNIKKLNTLALVTIIFAATFSPFCLEARRGGRGGGRRFAGGRRGRARSFGRGRGRRPGGSFAAVGRGRGRGRGFAMVGRGRSGRRFAAVGRGRGRGRGFAAVGRGRGRGRGFAMVGRGRGGRRFAAVGRGRGRGFVGRRGRFGRGRGRWGFARWHWRRPGWRWAGRRWRWRRGWWGDWRWRRGWWLGAPIGIWAWRYRPLEAYTTYHEGLTDYLQDRMKMPFWEVINETGSDITIMTEDRSDPGRIIPAGEQYGSEIWHSNSFNFRALTKDGRSKVFYNVQDHFVKIYSDPNGELQIETWNE